MSDEAKKRSSAWIWWAALTAALLYAVSVIPAAVTLRWLVHEKVVAPESFLVHGLQSFYAPVEWLARRNRHVFDAISELIRHLSP